MKEFQHILFYEKGHKYINRRNNKRYTSVTQTLKKVQPDVNWDYWAVYKHLKNEGNTVRPNGDEQKIWLNNQLIDYRDYIKYGKALRKQWNSISKTAKTKGTFIHLYLENLFNNKVINVPAKYKNCVKGAEKFYNDHIHLTPIYAELIVADDDYEVAGQVDRPFFIEPGLLGIMDFKTDREISFTNQYANLKPPVADLPDTNFSKYTLQLNLYRYIIEKNTEWKVQYLKIVHLTDDDYKIYDVPFYNAEVIL